MDRRPPSSVGPSGEEIECDKYGRIKVQFHWDRIGENNEKSSCWIRVAQLMAGAKWGKAVFTPRIGMEVIVDFLEGDPDKPICTGSVYNADNMPPWELPANKTQSGFKRSAPRTAAPRPNFNELRFEDKKGSEEIYFHAEKDMNTVVRTTRPMKVGFEKKDDGDQTIEIFNNQDIKVGCSEPSDGSQTLEVWKDRTTTIKTGDETLTVEKGKREISVDTDDNILTVKKGDRTTKVNLGKDLLQAMKSIELKCGASSIKLETAKITIKSVQIDIKGMPRSMPRASDDPSEGRRHADPEGRDDGSTDRRARAAAGVRIPDGNTVGIGMSERRSSRRRPPRSAASTNRRPRSCRCCPRACRRRPSSTSWSRKTGCRRPTASWPMRCPSARLNVWACHSAPETR